MRWSMLSKQGVSCTQLTNPTILPDILPTLERLHLVFLDLEMPSLDGYSVKDIIKAHVRDALVIAYTVPIHEINMVRQMGFDGFLGKPLDNTRFPDQLARILRGESVWERAAGRFCVLFHGKRFENSKIRRFTDR